MDYRKAWDEVKSGLVDAITEGQYHGYDGESENYYSGMYKAYKKILDKMIALESEDVTEGIKVGDTVRVVNPDLCYTSHVDWIKRNVNNPFLAVRWAANRATRRGLVGLVRYVAPHSPENDALIAYVDIGHACFMIDVNGVEKVKEV